MLPLIHFFCQMDASVYPHGYESVYACYLCSTSTMVLRDMANVASGDTFMLFLMRELSLDRFRPPAQLSWLWSLNSACFQSLSSISPR